MAAMPISATQLTLFSPLDVPARVSGSETSQQVSTVPPDRWSEVLGELQCLRGLEDDWDGQGASAPDAANVDSAIAWVEQMRGQERALQPSQVVPGVAGEVYLVWRAPAWFLEAEISRPDQVEWLLAVEGQPTRQWKTDHAALWLVGPLS